jgi:hypothetical protein
MNSSNDGKVGGALHSEAASDEIVIDRQFQ